MCLYVNVSFETFSRQTTIPITIEVKYRGTREEGGSPKDGEIEYRLWRDREETGVERLNKEGKRRGESLRFLKPLLFRDWGYAHWLRSHSKLTG